MPMLKTLALCSIFLICRRFATGVPLYQLDETDNIDLPADSADSNACKDDRDCSWIVKNVGEGEPLKKYCNTWKHKKAIQECRETCKLCQKAPSPIECDEPKDCVRIVDLTGGGENLKKYCDYWKDDSAVKECRKTCGFCNKPPSPTNKPETVKPATEKPTQKVTLKPTKKPTKTPKPTEPSGETPSGFQKACLEAHNDFRFFHGVPLLKWSAKLTSDAQAWADHLAASGKFQHDPTARGKDQGENLYYVTFQPLPKRLCAYGEQGDCLSCEEIVQAWYDEEVDYDYDTGKPKTLGAVILHFTQLIWKATNELGMATAVAGNRVVAVARYSPVGNWEGEFKENVPPPINVP
ncbi:uncharacterized protein [Porites lutea]|uniref:uncharacterized protein isoform X2 n=1 Tax=Porites lutea TaxID=51062 RepID=UPI003CC6059B